MHRTNFVVESHRRTFFSPRLLRKARSFMNHDAGEWIKKAEEDNLVAHRLFRMRAKPDYDVLCFHAQQCAEKYLKGALVADGKSFPKIHDLRVLLDKLRSKHPEWNLFDADANML